MNRRTEQEIIFEEAKRSRLAPRVVFTSECTANREKSNLLFVCSIGQASIPLRFVYAAYYDGAPIYESDAGRSTAPLSKTGLEISFNSGVEYSPASYGGILFNLGESTAGFGKPRNNIFVFPYDAVHEVRNSVFGKLLWKNKQ